MKKFSSFFWLSFFILLAGCGSTSPEKNYDEESPAQFESGESETPEEPTQISDFQRFYEEYPKLEKPVSFGPEELENPRGNPPVDSDLSNRFIGRVPILKFGRIEFEGGFMGIIYFDFLETDYKTYTMKVLNPEGKVTAVFSLDIGKEDSFKTRYHFDPAGFIQSESSYDLLGSFEYASYWIDSNGKIQRAEGFFSKPKLDFPRKLPDSVWSKRKQDF